MTRSRPSRPGLTDGPSTRYKPMAPASGQRVLREAILDKVFSPQAPSLVVLQAPAGHGKSTVLRQIRDECEARHMRCAWLNMDEADNDGRRHSTHLQRMLRQLFIHDSSMADASTASNAQLQDRADWFVEILDRDETPVALFVDEFEVLTDRAVLAFWRDLLLKLPDHVQVFLAARVSPDVGIPRLTVSDRILVLSSRDLCFSEDEVHSFFQTTGSEPTSDSVIKAIHRCTEGWPAAIQLFRLGLARMSPSDVLKELDEYRPRELADYLTECVLDGLASDIRIFLQRTSLLNRMNAQVCNALTGRSDSQSVLTRLEKQGLFVSAIDEGHVWFRYHSLFATQLREQLLTEDQARFRTLHREAAAWFHANGIHDDAMHHAVSANDLPFAADILEEWSDKLVSDGELSIAERWYDCLPAEEVRKRQALQRRIAWALAFLRQHNKLKTLMGISGNEDWLGSEVTREELPVRSMVVLCADNMAQAFDTSSRVQAEASSLDHFTAFELAAAANLDAFRYLTLGDFHQADLRLATAQALNQKGQAFFSGGYTAAIRGLHLMLRGRTSEAMEALQAALAEQRRALDMPFATAPLACCYLWTLYEANQLDDILKTFSAYREMVLTCPIPDLFAVGILSTARAYRLLGRESDFFSLLSEAEVLAQQNRWPRIVGSLRRERELATPSSRRGKVTTPKVVPAAESSSWLTFEELFTDRRIEPIRALIRQERYNDASNELNDLLALRPDCTLLQTKLGFCKAILLHARGLKNPAARQFTTTLKLAFESGFLRAVLDESRLLGPLIDDYLESTRTKTADPLHAFAQQIKSALHPSQAQEAQDDDDGNIDISQFSEREREIIECLSQRMSNQEIARSTHISENTVKFHLKKIFAKLGVSRRIEAYSALIGLKSPLA
ncbi:MAG: winged helix-turn-helix transcriptional regulator [Rhizobium sp.]|nr:MAG: winged helix-turn-helix transcriptional regulator [Rhizobium sp.]